MQNIDVAQTIAPSLTSRDVSDILERRIRELRVREVTLDLRSVRFVSRSAAHELLKLQKSHTSFWRRSRLTLTNVSPDVRAMFDIVARQRKTARPIPAKITSVKFKEFSEV
ncbi:MAG: STAS domain-containing protein [Patescibacteria group bacterium]